MNTLPSKETRNQLESVGLEYCQTIFKDNVDILLPLCIYETAEEVLSEYSIRDYMFLFNRVDKLKGHKKSEPTPREVKEEDIKKMTISYILSDDTDLTIPVIREPEDDINENYVELDLYAPYEKVSTLVNLFEYLNLDTLKKLHNSKIVYDVTKYILYMRKTRGEMNLYINPDSGQKTFYLKLQRSNARYRMEKENIDENEKAKNQMIYNGCYWAIKLINNPSYFKQNKDLWDRYNYIIKILQIGTTDCLKKLIKYSENQFEVKLKGNAKGLNIYKYDAKDKHLICAFVNRQECIDKEGMSRSTLSRLLSPNDKLSSWHKRIYIEITKEEAEKLNYDINEMLKYIKDKN